jgi:hypothetical protein
MTVSRIIHCANSPQGDYEDAHLTISMELQCMDCGNKTSCSDTILPLINKIFLQIIEK